MVLTTISVDSKTREVLDSRKIHPRQSYDELINLIIMKLDESNKELLEKRGLT